MKKMVLITPDDWHDLPAELLRSSDSAFRAVVIGPKGAGKSTLIKFLSKKLVSSKRSICVLETDCGQPELVPPGVLGLSYSLPDAESRTRLVSQRFLGFVNPSNDPFSYIETVEKVYQDYKDGFADSPLLINCHGWHTGAGKETWEAIITLVQPHFVIHVGSENPEISFEHGLAFLSDSDYPTPTPRWISASRVVIVDPPSGNIPNSSDKRWVKYASHFRQDLVRKDVFKSCNISEFFAFPLCSFVTLQQDKVAVEFPCADAIPDEKFRAIELTLVGLGNRESGQCYCLGFVMSFSETSVTIAVPTHIPKRYEEYIDVIYRGDLNWSPRDGVSHKGKTTSTDFTSLPDGEPYFLTNVLVGEGTGARVVRNRTNLKRRRLENS